MRFSKSLVVGAVLMLSAACGGMEEQEGQEPSLDAASPPSQLDAPAGTPCVGRACQAARKDEVPRVLLGGCIDGQHEECNEMTGR